MEIILYANHTTFKQNLVVNANFELWLRITPNSRYKMPSLSEVLQVMLNWFL